MPQPSSTRQVSSTGLSRRCCLRASPDRPTRLRLAVPKWTRRQGEETPLGPSSGEETPISQDGMSYRVRSLPSSLFHPSNRALPSDCVARVEKLCPEHHLLAPALSVEIEAMGAFGYDSFLMPASPGQGSRNSSQGGVGILVKTHLVLDSELSFPGKVVAM